MERNSFSGTDGRIIGGAKGYVGPPSQIIGGAWPSLAPPLPTPMHNRARKPSGVMTLFGFSLVYKSLE